MFATVLRIFTPSIANIILFTIVCAGLLSEKYQYIATAADTACPTDVEEKLNIGYPFVYFQYGRGSTTEFYPLKLGFAITLAYCIACLFVFFGIHGYRILKHGGKFERIILASVLSNIVLVGYVAIVVFGETLLAKAIQNQQRLSVKLLLTFGVSANRLTPNHASSSLLEATRVSNSEIVKLLLNAGAHPDIINRDKTSALHLATQKNNSLIAQKLLKSGASINLRDKANKTALHYACSYTLTKLLTENGSDVNALDMFDNTALDYIKDDAIKSLLLGVNAKRGVELKTPLKNPIPTISTNAKDAETPIKPDNPVVATEKPVTLRILPTAKHSLSCPNSIGGILFRAGKKIPVAESLDGKLIIHHGGHGFIYAKCTQAGYYHIVIDNERDYRKYLINLYSDPADVDAPLLAGKKDTALIPFDMNPGKIWIRYYFSTKKIDDIYAALEKGDASVITQINAVVRKER